MSIPRIEVFTRETERMPVKKEYICIFLILDIQKTKIDMFQVVVVKFRKVMCGHYVGEDKKL